ncbi:DUF6879 family protein [Amycolatopsis pigmentata]|uniref:DUF6879 family protein n=1 Tax=Amycolatopsis pigmentata TaxID=450801 RepID=A0ABW5G7I1_9PSEU
MPEVGDRFGERLELEAYLDDFDARFWALGADGVWKLERLQHFRQPESPSWVAFSQGEWNEALRLLEGNRSGLEEEFRKVSEAGSTVQRVRVVEEPVVPYLQWELHSLRLRAECGENIRVVRPQQVAEFESDGILPEVVTLGAAVLYRLVYTTDGLLDGAVRFTDSETVTQWREFIQQLYADGEDLASFFEHSVARLKPPYVQ